jgi:putative ATP-dependent endonuclease of OLD family
VKSNFQSCGPAPLHVSFDGMTYVLGPNGAGKTGLLQALARLFGVDPSLRKIRRSDFHVPAGEADEVGKERILW